jgi:two-component system, NtrC family, sensor kinase
METGNIAEILPVTDDRYRRIFNKNNAIMLFVDPETSMIIDANEAACSFYGYSRDQFKIMNFSQITQKDDESAPLDISTSSSDEWRQSIERHLLSDGDARDVEVFCGPMQIDTKPLLYLIINDITERKLAEEALCASRNFYLNLFEMAPVLIWRVGPDGRFDYFNRNWLDFTGKASSGECFAGLAEFIHPEDTEGYLNKFQEALNASYPFDIEYRLKRNDGEYRWIHTMAKPFSDGKGIFSGFIGFSFDKTENYNVEEFLRKLSRAVEQSSSSVVITDTEGLIEYVNDSYLRMTGFSLSELIGNLAAELKESGLADIFGNGWEILVEKGEWRGEIQSKRKNGEFYWEFVSLSSIKDQNMRTTHYLAVKEDITARKLAERELGKSRAELLIKHVQLKSLFDKVESTKKEWENTMDCIGDIVVLVDSGGKIKRCNKALKEFTSLTYEQIVGMSWDELCGLNNLPSLDKVSSRMQIEHKESKRWFVYKTYPFTSREQNEITGFVITLHDFTQQKKVSDELEKAYTDLKATQAKVVQQEKMASIGQLAAGVAHEINNPMGFISSNLGTLGKYLDRLYEFINFISLQTETIVDDQQRQEIAAKRKALKVDYILDDAKELLKESLEGGSRVRTIVQNLKSFSRVDEAQFKLADINECLESTINIVWNELKYKTVLQKDLGNIPMTKCYPQQLNQVFMNLLVNASQAIENQGEIGVKTWNDESEIFISVSDTGCGIPQEIVNRIFEPFFTTKEVGKGTGLGLSITYDIVKNHNGEIMVESSPGVGSKFTIRLPIVAGDPSQ